MKNNHIGHLLVIKNLRMTTKGMYIFQICFCKQTKKNDESWGNMKEQTMRVWVGLCYSVMKEYKGYISFWTHLYKMGTFSRSCVSHLSIVGHYPNQIPDRVPQNTSVTNQLHFVSLKKFCLASETLGDF